MGFLGDSLRSVSKYVAIFIAVALLLFLMNGLFFYILKGTLRRLGKFSQMNMLHQANVFDELIQNKEYELQDVEQRLEQEKGKPVGQEVRETRGRQVQFPDYMALMKGQYQDKEFTKNYHQIREEFNIDRAACVKDTADRAETAASNPAKSILSRFTLDVRYQLSTLDCETAFRVVEEELDAAEAPLLSSFRSSEKGDVLAFFDWLKVKAFIEAPEVIVRTGRKHDSFEEIDARVRTEYDGNVCEGVYVMAGGYMYDFALRDGEISG